MASSAFFHKPELALRRALELQGINQAEAALSLLHDVLSSRRHRTWSPAYEQIMMAYLDLCLKLHKAREAKDGLHQYRNLSQSQAPGSLEKVIRYLLAEAEKKCTAAKANADAEALLANTMDDEEDGLAGLSPQAILLSTMSTDPAKNQRDSTLLLPSLKFLWEIYRAVLDILRSNSKLEHVYHAAAVGALQFCRTYKRRTEFRRLCDMLRMHLGNLQKYGGSQGFEDSGSKPSNKVRGWDGWSSESIELHLQTRFAQLETASVLHLYTEGFRTVEDIYNILQISHARRKHNPDLPPPKAKLMAAYYEKLTTLFWVSENYLFHAFAWYKYYSLCKEYNRGMSDELKRRHASAVLLAALCIPGGSSGPETSTGKFDDSGRQEKMARMATLLGFHTKNPTREALLEEIQSKGIFEQVPEYLQQLYFLLEKDSDPLVLVEKAKPLLAELSQEVGSATGSASEEDNENVEDTTIGRYVQPLKSVLLLKLVLNLNSAYHTVKLDHLQQLTDGLGMSFEEIEKSIILFTQSQKGLTVRMDHRAGCLRFGDAQLESDGMRSQLTVLAHQLETVCNKIKPASAPNEAARATAFQAIRESRAADHAAILERKAMIEKRKEEAERLAQEKIKEEEQRKLAEAAARKAEEDKRIAREQQLREQEKQKKIQREMENLKKQQLLEALGQNTDAMTEDEIALIDAEKLQKEHQDKIIKKKEEADRKTRDVAKKLDYLVRAIRIEELPLVKNQYLEKTKKDKEQYEKEVVEKAKRAKAQWESDIKDKETLSSHSVFDHFKAFEDKVMEGRRLEHVRACKVADEEAEAAAEAAKMDRARKRKADERKRLAQEEQNRIREEEDRKTEEEQRKRQELRRQRESEEEERRRAEDARMQQERDRKAQEQSRAPGKYVPPSRRGGGGGGGGDSGGSRFGGGGDRYQGGGRYEGRRDDSGPGAGNSRWRK